MLTRLHIKAIKSSCCVLVICSRMKEKTRRDQDRTGITEKRRRITRKRITKRKKRKRGRMRLVETREPIGGQRCETDADFDQLQCLFGCPWSLSGLSFPCFPKE